MSGAEDTLASSTGTTTLGLAITIIPSITGTISFFSSASLICSIVRSNKSRRSREEILVGLSFLNCLFSAACAMSTFTGPEELEVYHVYILKGTIATCHFQGWMYQAGTAVPMYNSILCIYYLIHVKYKVPDEHLRKRTLPVMHAFVLFFSFGTATLALVLQLYNFGGMLGCWIADRSCDPDVELESCGRERDYNLFLWLFGGFPVLASLAVTIVTTTMLYCAVRSQEVKAHRHSYDYGRRPSSAPSGRSRSVDTEEVLESVEQEKTSLRDRFQCWLKQASTLKISAKVRDSGLLYVIAFWITYLPFLVIELCHLAGPGPPDWVKVANVTLLPLQGFFNMIIYQMPVWQYRQSQKRLTERRSSMAEAMANARRAHLFASNAAGSGEQGSRDSSPGRPTGGVPMIVDISSGSINTNEGDSSDFEKDLVKMPSYLRSDSPSRAGDDLFEP